MCNLSFIKNSSAFLYGEDVSWFCICHGYSGSIIIVFMASVCFTVGTPIHCLSLWVFLRGTVKPNMVFPLNMTILDLFFCIQCFADILDFKYLTVESYSLTTFLGGLCWTFRPLIQICTCIEQYLAVIHPVKFLRYKDIKYRIRTVTVAWLITLANSTRLVSMRMNYFQDNVYFVVFCIVLIITSFCCASVLHALKRPGPGDRNNVKMTEKDRPNNKTDKGRAVENQQKRRAFRIISHILVSILVSYFPIVLAYFMCITGVRNNLYLCNVIPPILSITKIALLISPLFRMYSEGYLEQIICFLKLRGQVEEN